MTTLHIRSQSLRRHHLTIASAAVYYNDRWIVSITTAACASMSREEDANRLADELEALRSGTLSESAFRAKCQTAIAPDLLSVIWEYLEHYLADCDIRERDSDYRVMQNAEFEKLVRSLRAGASDAELRKIHFLGYSS
jgi:hypothetical protein